MKAKKEKSEIPIKPIEEDKLPDGITEITGIVGYAINKGVVSSEQYEEFSKSHPVKFLRKCQWMDDIKAICNEQGILPEDMVREWKEAKEKIIELEKKSKNDINQPIRKLIGQDSISTNTGLSKWQLELRKKKLGI